MLDVSLIKVSSGDIWEKAFGSRKPFSLAYLRHVGKHHKDRDGQVTLKAEDKLSILAAGYLFHDLLTFRLGKMRYTTTAAYCAAPPPFGSIPGFGPIDKLLIVTKTMEDRSNGFMLITGLDACEPPIFGWSWKRHCPTVDLEILWDDYEEYLLSLRASYRRKVNIAMIKGAGLKKRVGTKTEFQDKHFKQYCDMVSHARNPQYLLPFNYFFEMPIAHHYLFLDDNDGCVGWVLLIPDGEELWFLQPAYNRFLRDKYDIYFNLLIETVRFGIENNYKTIRFGQEALAIKNCLGGIIKERYLLVRHSNPFINKIIKHTQVFNFKGHFPLTRPFKIPTM